MKQTTKKTTKKTAVKTAKTAVKRAAPASAAKRGGNSAAKSAAPAKKKAEKKNESGFCPAKKDPTFADIKKCWKALDEKKAENLKVLDVRGKSPITNYFIIATATSEPHMKALAAELEKTLKQTGVQAIGRDYKTESGWAVVDAFDFMAHIFLPEQRGLYGIESLWKDAEEVKMK